MQTNVNQKIISNKIGLLTLATELQNVSKACKIMGYSRDTFYRYKELKEEGGVDALYEVSKRKPNLKNGIDEKIEDVVVKLEHDNPAFGQKRASNELRKIGVFVSPAGVRCIWQRHDLESFQKRLLILEKRSAELGLIFTEAQLAALEKKQDDDVAHGEIGEKLD